MGLFGKSFLKQISNWFYDLKNNKSLFVPISDNNYVRTKNTPKVFAYYLPQFHSIPENDKAHGKGFTEWVNVASCLPQFYGHHQPKIPYDVGFYDLSHVEVMHRQVELAKKYGLYGFCFYYYWFSGKKLLELPLENFLKSDIDFHFHFCWANENWSKLWDGGDREVIVKQELKEGDAEKFFEDIKPFILDSRYEKIGNKPILMIYNPSLFERTKLKNFMEILDKLAKTIGFEGFYFTASNFKDFSSPKEWGFEGITEFPPHTMWNKGTEKKVQRFCKKSNFSLFNIDKYIEDKKYIYSADYDLFKACFPSWDNTPRKAFSNGVCFDMSDKSFEDWLCGIIQWTKENNSKDKQYVYINAWNEWAEGAILEPNTRYGYKNLSIVRKCLEKFD